MIGQKLFTYKKFRIKFKYGISFNRINVIEENFVSEEIFKDYSGKVLDFK